MPISPAQTQIHAPQGTSSASICSSAWRTCWTEDMGVSALVFWGSAQFFGVYSFSRHFLCSSRFVLARPRRGDRQRPQRRRGGARQRSTRRTSHVVRRSGSETPGPRGFMSLTITCECRSRTHTSMSISLFYHIEGTLQACCQFHLVERFSVCIMLLGS